MEKCSSKGIFNYTTLLDHVLSALAKDSTNTSEVLGLQSARFSTQFYSFAKQMAAVDETWGFWVQFIFCDAMAYIGLYIGVRTGDWDLRTASLKLMAPLFTAFDHPTYQKLISNHIADILDMPPSLLMLKQGGFVVSISGREGHSVAIDEAHKMLINKNIKEAVVKPSEDYMKVT